MLEIELSPFFISARSKNMPKTLSQEDIEGYKSKLLALRARLRGDVNTMADAALNKSRMESSGDLSAMPIHMADVGTDNFEQEFTLSLMESESETLSHIEYALKRVEQGTYGECEDCEKGIPKARLNAIPYTSKCVKCASESERNR